MFHIPFAQEMPNQLCVHWHKKLITSLVKQWSLQCL